MIAPNDALKKLGPDVARRLALGMLLRRARTARAFEDKQGGWTLVTSTGLAMRVTGAAAVFAWERLQGSGCTTWELAADLARRFPHIGAERIERDLILFHGHLLEHGFIEVLPRRPRLPPRCPPPQAPA